MKRCLMLGMALVISLGGAAAWAEGGSDPGTVGSERDSWDTDRQDQGGNPMEHGVISRDRESSQSATENTGEFARFSADQDSPPGYVGTERDRWDTDRQDRGENPLSGGLIYSP